MNNIQLVHASKKKLKPKITKTYKWCSLCSPHLTTPEDLQWQPQAYAWMQIWALLNCRALCAGFIYEKEIIPVVKMTVLSYHYLPHIMKHASLVLTTNNIKVSQKNHISYLNQYYLGWISEACNLCERIIYVCVTGYSILLILTFIWYKIFLRHGRIFFLKASWKSVNCK
jgi:hypothetical protein